jgi:hypothetical protein
MKFFVWAIVAFLLIHCGDDTLTPPQITVDLNGVWLGERSIAEDAPEREVNLLIQNKGEEKLVIESAVLKGDQHCAFTIEGPDKKKMGENDSAFIRIIYKPSVRADDNVGLIIKSNSEKKSKLVIPICGKGVLPDEIVITEGDTDSEAEDLGEDRICEEPPADQPDCELTTEDTEGE